MGMDNNLLGPISITNTFKVGKGCPVDLYSVPMDWNRGIVLRHVRALRQNILLFHIATHLPLPIDI